jgi:hypothetical protein
VTTREQRGVIEALSLEHGTVESWHPDASPALRVRCADGFGCILDEDGEMTHREGNTAVQSWPR